MMINSLNLSNSIGLTFHKRNQAMSRAMFSVTANFKIGQELRELKLGIG